MKTDDAIEEAIGRSISHNEIVHVTINGDSGDALESIRAVFDGDTDYTMIDREGCDLMDVWSVGGQSVSLSSQSDWRLAIDFQNED